MIKLGSSSFEIIQYPSTTNYIEPFDVHSHRKIKAKHKSRPLKEWITIYNDAYVITNYRLDKNLNRFSRESCMVLGFCQILFVFVFNKAIWCWWVGKDSCF